MSADRARVAIVDLGMGNLHSVSLACARVGASGVRTASPDEVLAADAVILPGVGAFGAAMEALRRGRLIDALHHTAASGKPLFGICLGLQLLFDESEEFGRHEGLGLVSGRVVRLPTDPAVPALKVPQVGWNSIRAVPDGNGSSWRGTPLDGQRDGEEMYFVHSYYVAPDDAGAVLSTTTYGPTTYCSSLRVGSIFGCQFHPERSGARGLELYRRWARDFLPAAGSPMRAVT